MRNLIRDFNDFRRRTQIQRDLIERAPGVFSRKGFHEEDLAEAARLAKKWGMRGSLQGWGETIYASLVDGAALTAAASASMLPAPKLQLPNNFWSIGKAVRITAFGRISSVITTPGTARYDVRQGSTVIFDGLAVLLDTVAAHTNVGWELVINMICRAQGATGNVWGQGRWFSEDILGTPATAPKGSLTAMLPWNTAPAVGGNFDTQPSQTLDINFTQTVATGSMTCHGCIVESLN